MGDLWLHAPNNDTYSSLRNKWPAKINGVKSRNISTENLSASVTPDGRVGGDRPRATLLFEIYKGVSGMGCPPGQRHQPWQKKPVLMSFLIRKRRLEVIANRGGHTQW